MFIRLEDTNKESGIPIIAFDMDDNGNNRPNAEFTVTMPEITLKKDDQDGTTKVVNPCAAEHASCGLCENGALKKIFSFNNEDDNGNLKMNKQWANMFLEFNNIVQFRNRDKLLPSAFFRNQEKISDSQRLNSHQSFTGTSLRPSASMKA